jgi:hypothetical protein
MLFTVCEDAGRRRFIDTSPVDKNEEILANPSACAKLIINFLMHEPVIGF